MLDCLLAQMPQMLRNLDAIIDRARAHEEEAEGHEGLEIGKRDYIGHMTMHPHEDG